MSNRATRRAEAKGAAAKRALKHVPQATSTPSSEMCDGICRGCSRRRQLFLPARICGRCIETAMEMAREMSKEQAEAMLAAIEEMESEDVS